MIIEILRRTPPWVFALFVLLLYLGYAQSRKRTVTTARLAILPVLMPTLSLSGVLSVFGADPVALSCWLAGLIAAAVLVRAIGVPKGVAYSPDSRTFSVPGSWWPLALIMAIFFARYAVTVALAMNPSLARLAAFAAAVGATYGLPSGYFVARALNIRGAAA